MIKYGDKGKSILVVEDEPAICEILLIVLGREGYEVEIATNGKKGAEKIKEREYDIIIIDMRTPVMDGKELYRRICEEHPDMIGRIIMTSGDIMGKDMQEFINKAGVKFLIKPFTSDEIKEAVEDVFQKRNRQL